MEKFRKRKYFLNQKAKSSSSYGGQVPTPVNLDILHTLCINYKMQLQLKWHKCFFYTAQLYKLLKKCSLKRYKNMLTKLEPFPSRQQVNFPKPLLNIYIDLCEPMTEHQLPTNICLIYQNTDIMPN